MFSKEELVKKYETLTEEELHSYYKQLETLSTEGQEALYDVINSRGGVEHLTNAIANKAIIDKEKARIIYETKAFAKSGADIDFIKKTTTSSVLNADAINDIVTASLAEASAEQRDTQINPKTIYGSIIGGLIASIIGGTLWGIWLIETHRIFYIFIVGLALLSYLLINRITRQTKNNAAVLIATIISTLIAVVLGQQIFNFFG